MNLRAKLAVGIVLLQALFVVPLLLSLRSMQQLHATTAKLRDTDFAASLLLGRLRGGTDELRTAETALLFVHDAESRDRVAQELDAVSAMADSLGAFALDSAAQHFRSALSDVGGATAREYEAALSGRVERAESISTREVRPAIARVERWIAATESALSERTRRRVGDAAAAIESAQQFALAGLLLTTLVGSAIGVGLFRAISRPVRLLERGMKAVADGDFDYELEISPNRRDEFGRLAASYTSMASQLAELDKLKAEFVSVASHELKTPINVIQGYVQLLEEGVYGELSAKQREICHTLDAQCQALSRLVKQLLDVSRFEAGGGKLEVRRVHLPLFLTELQRSFQVLAHQRGVAFRIEHSDELPKEVFWDEDRMNEVLGNLLANAFKFTGRGGRVELVVDANVDAVQLEVRDTGAGIPPEQLPHVFEKFYQADNQHSAAAQGTGLGLAIAKEIVEAHGGTILVESTPGVGTSFFISMPVDAAGGSRARAPHSPVPAGATA